MPANGADGDAAHEPQHPQGISLGLLKEMAQGERQGQLRWGLGAGWLLGR